MRVLLSWLKDFVEITVPAEELARRLTFAGLEVESIEYIGLPSPTRSGGGGEVLAWDRDRIFVGQLVEVKPHPNADRLTLAIVDYGRGEPIQVVTGAPNIRVGDRGQKVVLALEGARLYDGHKPGRELMTLKKSKIRGVESGSMVCSEKELGLSDEHEGIIILPNDAPVGTPLVDYLGDVVFDIKINPNFARAQSVLGIAREVAALTGQKLKAGAEPVNQPAGPAETDFVKIEIADPRLCARYSAAMIREVEIKPSPFWMQRRLDLAGMRPINNIVDITNYVMIGLGQPLHAFDYDQLVARAGHPPQLGAGHPPQLGANGKPTIIVRPAHPGETMQTLDGVTREFTGANGHLPLLITDTAGPIAIAGVMGGAETEVSDATRNILLESANFDFISIRRTTQEQKLPSEAATRFGRGIHPSSTIPAARHAAELMHELGGGKVEAAIADNYPAPVTEPTIELTTREVTRLLGIELSTEQITQILQSLDFKIETRGPGTLAVTPPDYRLDVDGTDDVIEEIVRIYGYERVPSVLMADELPPQRNNVELEREEAARDLLVNAELQEVVTYTMTTPAHEAALTPSPAERVADPRSGAEGRREGVGVFDPLPSRPYIEIENPISAERTVMRQALLPSVLDVVASNLRFTNRVALFEIGKVFLNRWENSVDIAGASEEELEAQLPLEKTRLAIVLTGPREESTWQGADTAMLDFFDLKGVVEEFAQGLHVRDVSYAPSDNPLFHPGRAAVMRLGAIAVGVFGELHPVVREHFNLSAQPALVGEFDLEAILAQTDDLFHVRPLSRYPAVVQDIALIVDESAPAARVVQLIRQTGGALLANAWLFDVYRGEPLPPGSKSLAYRLTFQAMDRGLTDADAAKLRDKIVQRLKRELGAELRSG
jgi:phenylalanyl-tRNA synthetase beta chain